MRPERLISLLVRASIDLMRDLLLLLISQSFSNLHDEWLVFFIEYSILLIRRWPTESDTGAPNKKTRSGGWSCQDNLPPA